MAGVPPILGVFSVRSPQCVATRISSAQVTDSLQRSNEAIFSDSMRPTAELWAIGDAPNSSWAGRQRTGIVLAAEL